MPEVKELNASEFQEFITNPKNEDEVAVVDFFATWCGPCRLLLNRLKEEIDTIESSGKVRVAKLDVEAQNEISKQYGIKSLPTVIFFRNGEVIHEMRKSPNIQTIKDTIEVLTTDKEDEF